MRSHRFIHSYTFHDKHWMFPKLAAARLFAVDQHVARVLLALASSRPIRTVGMVVREGGLCGCRSDRVASAYGRVGAAVDSWLPPRRSLAPTLAVLADKAATITSLLRALLWNVMEPSDTQQKSVLQHAYMKRQCICELYSLFSSQHKLYKGNDPNLLLQPYIRLINLISKKLIP